MRTAIGALLTGLLLAYAAMAQQAATGPTSSQAQIETVVIRVMDPRGAGVHGAQVRIAPFPERRLERMETDNKGELALQLKPGSYAMVVQERAFRNAITRIDVKAGGGIQTFPVLLQVGAGGGVKPAYEKDVLVLSVDPFLQVFRIKVEELKEIARKTVAVHNPHSNADEKYEGVELADLLTKYGAPLGKELRGPALANYVVATGSDGYKVVFSLAEVDPSFHPGNVLVADTMNGKPLDAHTGPFRLVVTEDQRPARGVRNLVSLEVKAAQ
jgi:hypothetical protein